MNRLLTFLILVGACVVVAATTARAAFAVSCSTDYGWGEKYYYPSTMPSTLSGTISDVGSYASGGSPYYDHAIGRIGEQVGTGVPEVQTGIEYQNGVRQFYFEEAGASSPPSGWTPIWDAKFGVYFYDDWFGSPAANTAYSFKITKSGNNYQLFANGTASPVITESGDNELTYTNEVYDDSGVCPTSNFEFQSPSPWNFTQYSYRSPGIDPSFFNNYFRGTADWVSLFPTGNCIYLSPPCQVPTKTPAVQPATSVIFTDTAKPNHG